MSANIPPENHLSLKEIAISDSLHTSVRTELLLVKTNDKKMSSAFVTPSSVPHHMRSVWQIFSRWMASSSLHTCPLMEKVASRGNCTVLPAFQMNGCFRGNGQQSRRHFPLNACITVSWRPYDMLFHWDQETSLLIISLGDKILSTIL